MGRWSVFIAALWAGASWLFFRVARSTRMIQIWTLRSRLEKQPTDLRQTTSYFGDRTLGSTPLWFFSARSGEPATDTFRIEISSVDRSIGLLPPRLIETAGINTIKSKLINELQDDGLRVIIIACYWQRNSPHQQTKPPSTTKSRPVQKEAA